MRKKYTFLSLIILVLCIQGFAASFKETAKYLDTDGSVIGYIDFEGDGTEIATQLQTLYTELGTVMPQAALLPLNFERFINHLGLAAIESFGYSSKEISNGKFLNRTAVLLSQPPTGLLKFYSLEGAKPAPFSLAKQAPADVDGILSGPFNWIAVVNAVETMAVEVMGPLGQMIVQGQLAQPLLGSEVTLLEIITSLSAHWDGYYKIDLATANNPDFDFWVRVKGAGYLLKKMQPQIQTIANEVSEVEGNLRVNLSNLMSPYANTLFLETTTEGDLLAYTDRSWAMSKKAPRLSDLPEFKDLMQSLPKQGLWHTYNSGMNLQDSLQSAFSTGDLPEMYSVLFDKALENFFADLDKPYASVGYYNKGNLISHQIGSFSPKQLMGIIPLSIAFGAAYASLEDQVNFDPIE